MNKQKIQIITQKQKIIREIERVRNCLQDHETMIDDDCIHNMQDGICNTCGATPTLRHYDCIDDLNTVISWIKEEL